MRLLWTHLWGGENHFHSFYTVITVYVMVSERAECKTNGLQATLLPRGGICPKLKYYLNLLCLIYWLLPLTKYDKKNVHCFYTQCVMVPSGKAAHMAAYGVRAVCAHSKCQKCPVA